MTVIRTLFLLVTLVAVVSCYSSGAPTQACDTMVPQHSPNPNNVRGGQRPYTVEAPGKVRPGERTTIRLSGAKFKGFMVRVLDRKGNSGGRFEGSPRSNWHPITCQNTADTATHASNVRYTTLDLTWTAPQKPGTYQVVATIVQEYDQFYTGYHVDVVVVGDASDVAGGHPQEVSHVGSHHQEVSQSLLEGSSGQRFAHPLQQQSLQQQSLQQQIYQQHALQQQALHRQALQQQALQQQYNQHQYHQQHRPVFKRNPVPQVSPNYRPFYQQQQFHRRPFF